ncbi:thiamine pyrophosphate-binding protein [Nonomuraea sp. K274]|uniref:Thiamine pyrophosphate-binding protein n=1 Tax=Nonomuraea cypriaca TaxID=1187855 RepID=A0A931EYB9_9ACTN|nr:thiamine pyrophosphate-dependent enzyme [Nonomuraea cypriaca]MBF8187160.1 thiamine pyrophosphate-binding protein [Nonomuraea cypriaca]
MNDSYDTRGGPIGVRTGGRLFVDSLVSNGVDFMTCVPGESFLPILDALYDVAGTGTGGPRLVTTRHEAAAANMAEAAGKLTGRVAACLVTRGPGAMHASIAVHTAYQDGTPMLLVVGQVARSARGREAFQEMDYSAVFGSTAKSVVEITDAGRIPEHVARAVYLATSGRPGPVVLAIPEDVLSDVSAAEPIPAPVTEPVPPAAAAADRLMAALAAAERPLLIVAFGPRLDDPTTDGFALTERPEPGRRVITVSDDPDEACRALIPDGVLICSLEPLARLLAERSIETASETEAGGGAGAAGAPAARSAGASGSREKWLGALRASHERFSEPPAAGGAVDLGRIVRHVRSVLPDDAVVTNGAGNYTVWLQRFFEFRRPGTQIAPHNGAMGYGFPAALAAAAVRPGTPVVAFAGDGCFLMSGSELATAVQQELDLVVIVVNNRMLGTIRMHQENHYPGRVIATDLRNPDFADYARSFGAPAWVVEETGQFADAFAAARAHRGPAVVEIRTDPAQITPDRRL